MALLHQATLTPTKLELLQAWLPDRTWADRVGGVEPLAAYRFDDPAGEVGLESFLLASGDTVLHVPLTYRAAPFDGAEEHLVGTCEHSVLGRRWVYDGCADPVWVAALAEAVLTGGTEAPQYFEVDGQRVPRESTATVAGSGEAGTPVPQVDTVTCHDDGPTTRVRAGGLELVVVRRVGTAIEAPATLTGRWPGGGPAVLAGVQGP